MSARPPGSLKERLARWRRFDAWTPPVSPRERRSRLDWLAWALREAGRRGLLREVPFDDPETLARRRRIRRALARIRG